MIRSLDDPVLTRIKLLNRYLNRKKYIAPDDFDRDYRVLSPEKFMKNGGGVCWDYCIYQAYKFVRDFPDVPFKTFYHIMIDGEDCPSHTWMQFYRGGKVFIFESSFKNIRGIYAFDTEDLAISAMHTELVECATIECGKNYEKIPPFLCQYDATDHKLPGMGCAEFMNYMARNPEYEYTQVPTRSIEYYCIMQGEWYENHKIVP